METLYLHCIYRCDELQAESDLQRPQHTPSPYCVLGIHENRLLESRGSPCSVYRQQCFGGDGLIYYVRMKYVTWKKASLWAARSPLLEGHQEHYWALHAPASQCVTKKHYTDKLQQETVRRGVTHTLYIQQQPCPERKDMRWAYPKQKWGTNSFLFTEAALTEIFLDILHKKLVPALLLWVLHS